MSTSTTPKRPRKAAERQQSHNVPWRRDSVDTTTDPLPATTTLKKGNVLQPKSKKKLGSGSGQKGSRCGPNSCSNRSRVNWKVGWHCPATLTLARGRQLSSSALLRPRYPVTATVHLASHGTCAGLLSLSRFWIRCTLSPAATSPLHLAPPDFSIFFLIQLIREQLGL